MASKKRGRPPVPVTAGGGTVILLRLDAELTALMDHRIQEIQRNVGVRITRTVLLRGLVTTGLRQGKAE